MAKFSATFLCTSAKLRGGLAAGNSGPDVGEAEVSLRQVQVAVDEPSGFNTLTGGPPVYPVARKRLVISNENTVLLMSGNTAMVPGQFYTLTVDDGECPSV